MLRFDDVLASLLRIGGPVPDDAQARAVGAPVTAGIRIVAGPGTGKTASLVNRIVKLLLVDGVPADGVLALTFTRKAATELRSRILTQVIEVIDDVRARSTPDVQAFLTGIDVGQVRVDTLDALCMGWVREVAGFDDPFAGHLDDTGSLLVMEQVVQERHDRPGWRDLEDLLHEVHNPAVDRQRFQGNARLHATVLHALWRRRLHDRVTWAEMVKSEPDLARRTALRELHTTHERYADILRTHGVMDYAMVQTKALRALQSSEPPTVMGSLRAICVDEYHDTDLLHQEIYLTLAQAPTCAGAITVVGDDDQGIYRFRGGTVELLAEFPAQYLQRFGREADTVILDLSYRSTPSIVAFVEEFGSNDESYQSQRARSRTRLRAGRSVDSDPPVFGLFRNTLPELATAMVDIVHPIRFGDGATLAGHTIRRHERLGTLADFALLCKSPQERDWRGDRRLPSYVRDAFLRCNPAIEVWNPRGTLPTNVPVITRVGGLALHDLDPDGTILDTCNISNDARYTLGVWRRDVGRDRSPIHDLILRDEVPVLTLLYACAGTCPASLIDRPEFALEFGLFLRQAEMARWIDPATTHVAPDATSRRAVIELVLAPIADRRRKHDDEGPDPLPRNRFAILSIHQAKGLEFPVAFVDAACFTDPKWDRSQRFPDIGSAEHRAERLMRPWTDLGPRLPRTDVDLAFDDVIRSYFVGFSRARDLLILVGLTPSAPGAHVQSSHEVAGDARRKGGRMAIPNVATGWTRDSVSHWDVRRPLVML